MDILQKLLQIEDETGGDVSNLKRLINSGQLTPASSIPQPDPKESVKEIELFNRFNRDYPNYADGGMLVQPSADGFRQEYSDGPKMTIVRDALDLLPKGSKVSPVDLANQLKLSRKLVDNALKEKKYKNKFNVVRKLDALSNQEFIDEYEKFKTSDFFKTGKDQEYADYLNDQGFKAEKGNKKFTRENVAIRRRRLNIDSASDFGALSDKEIKKEAKRFNINTKGLTPEEIRTKVLTKRTRENLLKRMAEDPEFAERYREEAIIRSKKRRKELLSTEEGRAKIKEQQKKEKAKKYLKEGLDPPANSAKEMLWKDTVKTAKEDSRFSIESGYKKSMKKDDYYSNKIKIKDSVTGKTFTFNTLENFINKNAGSFNIKNYEEVIRPYKQKQYINDKGLRNTLNEVLIPGWSGGDPRTAYTIQHDFGRKVNPFKVSLAFYDDNSKEYKIRSDFEKAWEKSKTSKTPLADKKLAFNTFKKDIDRLNIRSSPSMITRDRAFGKELDLKSILQKAKKEGAVFKRGTLKQAAEFDKQILNNIVANSKLKQCKIPAADGGRIGFALSDECIRDGLNETKKAAAAGDKKAARQLVETAEAASKGGRLLKNILGPGAILGEAVFEGAIIGNKVLGGKPADIAYAESYLSYLDPRKYSGQLDPLKMYREDMLESTADKNILQSGFDAQDRISAFNQALEDERIANFRQRSDQLMTEAEREKLRAYEKQSSPFIKDSQLQKDADIISSEAFKDASNIAQEYIQGQAGEQMAKFGVLSVPQGYDADNLRRLKANKAMQNLYTQYSDNELRSFLKQSLGTDDDKLIDEYLNLTGVTERITPAVTRTLSGLDKLRSDMQEYEAMQRIANAGGVANLAKGGRAGFSSGTGGYNKPSHRQYLKQMETDLHKHFKRYKRIYGGKMKFNQFAPKFIKEYADGGIASLSGGDKSGPPPERGPNSQGLPGLLKRVKKI